MAPKEGSAGGPGAGADFSPAVKQAAVDENAAANGGAAHCTFCGGKVSNDPGPDKVNIDHAIAKAKGGNNSLGNAQVTCQFCNQSKGANPWPKSPKPTNAPN
jgi:5-methylcytosine-specific restriction endonuclease McrA